MTDTATPLNTLDDVLRVVAGSGLYDMRGIVSRSMLPPNMPPGFREAVLRAMARSYYRMPTESTLKQLKAEQSMSLIRMRRDMIEQERTNDDGSTTISFGFKK